MQITRFLLPDNVIEQRLKEYSKIIAKHKYGSWVCENCVTINPHIIIKVQGKRNLYRCECGMKSTPFQFRKKQKKRNDLFS